MRVIYKQDTKDISSWCITRWNMSNEIISSWIKWEAYNNASMVKSSYIINKGFDFVGEIVLTFTFVSTYKEGTIASSSVIKEYQFGKLNMTNELHSFLHWNHKFVIRIMNNDSKFHHSYCVKKALVASTWDFKSCQHEYSYLWDMHLFLWPILTSNVLY